VRRQSLRAIRVPRAKRQVTPSGGVQRMAVKKPVPSAQLRGCGQTARLMWITIDASLAVCPQRMNAGHAIAERDLPAKQFVKAERRHGRWTPAMRSCSCSIQVGGVLGRRPQAPGGEQLRYAIVRGRSAGGAA
jgi:hypothetical protein